MDTNPVVINPPASRKRRRHSAEFKAQVIAACLQPGVSIAAVALVNQLNANFVRNWMNAYREREMGNPASKGKIAAVQRAAAQSPATLIPVKVQNPDAPPGGDIRIEIRQAQRVVQVSWPVSQADRCADWLREVLR